MDPTTTIAIASDHAGVALKTSLMNEISKLGLTPLDLGTNSTDSVDYPDMAHTLTQVIRSNKATRGILLCGSGIGVSIAANRDPAIRAALCHDTLTAELARLHNDANVLVLGARLIGDLTATRALHVFLSTPFEGGRHQRRVDKLSNPTT